MSRFTSRWPVLLVVWMFVLLACGQGGTSVIGGSSTSPSASSSKPTALVVVSTASALAGYPIVFSGSSAIASGPATWRRPWPGCTACFDENDGRNILAAAGTDLTELDPSGSGTVLAEVKLAGNVLAAPVIMTPSGDVLVVTTAGVQEVSALQNDPTRIASDAPSPPVAGLKASSGPLFVASAGMYAFIASGNEFAEIYCDGKPQDSLTVVVQTTLSDAAIGAPQVGASAVVVPTASGVAAFPFAAVNPDGGGQRLGAERDIPWPGKGGAASTLAITADGTSAYLASGNQLAQDDLASGKLVGSTALPGDLLSQIVLVNPYGHPAGGRAVHSAYLATSQGVITWDDEGPLDPSHGPSILWPHAFVVPPSPPPPPNANLPVLLAVTNTGDVLAASDGNDTVALRLPVIPPTHTALTSDAPVLQVGVLALT
jgi:hypothetical protein